MRIRLLALCLLACLLLGGCGIITIPSEDGTTTATSTTTTPSGGTEDKPTDWNAGLLATRESAMDAIADYDLGGEVFVIATTTPNRYAPAHDASDTISVSAHQRNEELKTRWNGQITTQAYTDAAEMLRAIKTASLSGLYLADLYAIPYAQIGTYVSLGLLDSVYDLPYLNTDQAVFHSELTRQSIIGTEAYAICTTAEYTPAEYPAVFFASAVTDYLGIDPYAHLSKGTWTWDTLVTIAEAATEAGFEGYAIAQSPALSLSLPELIVRTAAVHPVTNLRGETPTLDYGTRQTGKLFETIARVGALFHATEPMERSLFAEGGVLFYFDTLQGVEELTTTDYGLMPIPKYSNTQGGYTTMPTANTQVLTLPANATQSLSDIGKFVACYAAASYGRFTIAQTDAWLQNTLRTQDALTSIHYALRATVRADLSDCFGQLDPSESTSPAYTALATCLTDGTQDLLKAVYAGTRTPSDAVADIANKNEALQAVFKQHFPFA